MGRYVVSVLTQVFSVTTSFLKIKDVKCLIRRGRGKRVLGKGASVH